eukprot:7115787-Pyramimonas_sp.AAC.2
MGGGELNGRVRTAEHGERDGHERPDEEDDDDGAKGQRGGGAVGDGHRVEEAEAQKHGTAEQRARHQHVAHPVLPAPHLLVVGR